MMVRGGHAGTTRLFAGRTRNTSKTLDTALSLNKDGVGRMNG